MPLIDKVPPVRGKRGRPRFRPDALYADRGYGHDKYPAVALLNQGFSRDFAWPTRAPAGQGSGCQLLDPQVPTARASRKAGGAKRT